MIFIEDSAAEVVKVIVAAAVFIGSAVLLAPFILMIINSPNIVLA